MAMITPKSPPWDGASPLFNGLAVARALKVGSFGLALAQHNGAIAFTCARHVVGDGDAGGPLSLWTASGGSDPDWEPTSKVDVITPPAEKAAVYASLDLALVKLTGVGAKNDVFGLPLVPKVVSLDVGASLRYRGARNDWVRCFYQGPYTAGLTDAFGALELAGLDLSAMGVVALNPSSYDPAAYEGDSGAALWSKLPDGTAACLGAIVGVSNTKPLGLVLRFTEAFRKVGLADYKVVGAP
jgi:hypothetical protein